MKRNVLLRTGAFVGAAVLALTAPATAFAATGTFWYLSPHGVVRLTDPSDNVCHAIDAQGPLANETDRHAELYPNPDCEGPVNVTLNPGEYEPRSAARGVRFVP
ncbi:hypothetical protein [Kitasatospora sp. NPDC101183]|uniref:hypothetical protein n=1 Tax=Kitasatospora sp. NPDC101183 TaxID=3364100 RepID=UPI00382DB57B